MLGREDDKESRPVTWAMAGDLQHLPGNASQSALLSKTGGKLLCLAVLLVTFNIRK